MFGVDAFNVGYVELMSRMKALGANCVSPLFQRGNYGDYATLAHVKGFCDAARATGLLVGVNADHAGGRAWINSTEMVNLMNSYDHVFLENEIETNPSNPSDDQWQASAIDLMRSYRGAGHLSLIKVGAPQGGRRVGYPLRRGKNVLAADPLRNTCFTWQAYWEADPSGWQYQTAEGFVAGVEGTKAAIRACGTSGLVFVVGLDWQDDIGETGWTELAAECQKSNVSYQHWVLFGDGLLPKNNVLDHWNLKLENITETGKVVRNTLLAQRKMADL
jgi:hypothetical protein